MTSQEEIEYLENLLEEINDIWYADLIIEYLESKIYKLKEKEIKAYLDEMNG